MDSKNPMNAPRRPSDGSKNHHKDKEGGCPASVIASIGGNDRVIAVSKEMLNEEDLTQGKQGHKLLSPPCRGNQPGNVPVDYPPGVFGEPSGGVLRTPP